MRAAKVDKNQEAITSALLVAGCSVVSLARVGFGVPDLLIGLRGKNYCLEIKVAKGKLNPDQVAWHKEWRGQVAVVRTIEEAFKVVGL